MNTLFERTLRRRFRQKGQIVWLRVIFFAMSLLLVQGFALPAFPGSSGERTAHQNILTPED